MNSLNDRGEMRFQVTKMGIRIKKSSRMIPKNQSPGHEWFARSVSSSILFRHAGPGPGGLPQITSSGPNIESDSCAECTIAVPPPIASDCFRTLSTCCLLVSGFLTEITQQIHSLRASGVISSHFLRSAGSESRAFRKSAGTLWRVFCHGFTLS